MNYYTAMIALLAVSSSVLADPNPLIVDRTTQIKRDESRKVILERELQDEQRLLREAQQKLALAENQQTQGKATDLQDTVRQHTSNVEAIRRELALTNKGLSKPDAEQSARTSHTPPDTEKTVPSPDISGAAPSITLKNPKRDAIRNPGNARLVVFPYDRNNTFPIYLTEGLNTHIEFPEGEYVKTLSVSNCGQDSPYWTCSISEDRRHIWIKPKAADLTNAGTIVTNRRVYEVNLHAVTAGKDWYQRVTWEGGWQDRDIYEFRDPPSQNKTAVGIASSTDMPANAGATGFEKLRFAYAIEGDAPFRPQMVFDDGKFTWIQLRPDVQELPALFVLAKDEVELVNYTKRGDYLLVNRLVPGLLLKLGKAEVRIKNERYLARR